MSKNAKNKYETVVATGNVPIFSADTQIQEDKASMQLVEDFYSGTLGRYMEYESNRYPCRLTERNGKTYGFFEITKSGRGVLVCYDGCYPYTSAKLTDIPEFRQMSLYRLLEANACYKGLEATAHYHGMKSSLPYESFKLSPHHFCNKPFQAGKEFVPLDEKASYESELQDVLKSWYWRRFPNNINSDVPTEPESHRSGWLAMVFDFKDQYGLTWMKVIKLYFMLTDHTFAKCYIPLTRWFCQDTNSDFITTVGLPNKQILMNWPEISRAEEVIICPTVEDALAFQREAPDDGNEAFTAIMCDRGHYDQVDFSPLKGKKVNIMISNSDGYSLAESYLNTVPLYEYLRDKEGIPDIGFIQRQVVYPSLQGVFDIDALVKVHRNQKPYVTEGSVVELSESEFAIMVEKARAEIARKREQSQDLPFWERSTEGVNVPAPQAHTSLADCMISRPYIVGGTTTVIESAPGMGKSCLATAWGGNIAGSNEPFLAARCLTRSTRPDGRSNKVVYLVHDTDGQAAINDHRKDFAGNIGENDANFIQRNMAGDGTNYSLPNNYNAFRKLLVTQPLDLDNIHLNSQVV